MFSAGTLGMCWFLARSEQTAGLAADDETVVVVSD